MTPSELAPERCEGAEARAQRESVLSDSSAGVARDAAWWQLVEHWQRARSARADQL